MQVPALSGNEPVRLQALTLTGLLDSATEDRFDRITRLARRALKMPIVAMSLLDAGRQWFKSIQGLDVSETSRDVSFCGHTILGNDVLVVEDASGDERFQDNPLVTCDPHIAFYAGCPVSTPDGSQIGTLCVIDRKPRQFNADDIQTLRDLAFMVEREISVCFQDAVQAELLSQLTSAERQAMVDPLTRLWNRDGLDHKFQTMMAQRLNKPSPIAAMMIDIDHFKKLNDMFGHQVGDDVLREVARRIQNTLRDGDVVGRYGGDEFMVAVNRTKTPDAIMEIAQRLCKEVNERPIVIDSYPIETTISVGVSFAPSGRRIQAAELIKLADDALYASKGDGRNTARIEIAENVAEATDIVVAA